MVGEAAAVAALEDGKVGSEEAPGRTERRCWRREEGQDPRDLFPYTSSQPDEEAEEVRHDGGLVLWPAAVEEERVRDEGAPPPTSRAAAEQGDGVRDAREDLEDDVLRERGGRRLLHGFVREGEARDWLLDPSLRDPKNMRENEIGRVLGFEPCTSMRPAFHYI
jgi:hypothetical protein